MVVQKRLRPRERDSILQSLKAGVTPRTGLQHIQVGRVNEVKAILSDIERITDGGSAFRLIIGDYGSGKTFFLELVRSIAQKKNWLRQMRTYLQTGESMRHPVRQEVFIPN